ncbi:hypothetical protein KQI52_14735 [bacterium]|nr:hypothetical protein [bacterium]
MIRIRRHHALLLMMVLVTALFAASVCAQPPEPGNQPPMTEEQQEQLRQRVESMRIWKLTELLQLEPDEAAVFFPLYRQHLIKLDTLQRRQMELDQIIEAGLHGEDVDYDKLIKQSFDMTEQQNELAEKLIKDSGKVLSQQQQAALLLFERRFHQRLREMMFEISRDFGPPGMRRHGGMQDSSSRGMGRGYGGPGR